MKASMLAVRFILSTLKCRNLSIQTFNPGDFIHSTSAANSANVNEQAS